MPPAAGYPSRAARGASGEITLVGLVLTLRRGLWLLAATVLVCVLVTAAQLKVRAPIYTATMVVAPAEYDPAASLRATQIEQYARLATLGQMPLRSDTVSGIDRYSELLTSLPVAQRLEAEHQVLRRLFPAQWSAEKQAWHAPRGILAKLERSVRGFFGYPPWRPPGPADLAAYLASNLEISGPTQTTGLRRIALSHPDGQFAASLLAMAHAAADAVLREDARQRVDQQIAELERQLAETDDATRREALNALLWPAYQRQAVLASNLPFAAEIVSPPAAGAAPTSMGPLLVLALAAVVGAILGMFIVFLRDALRAGA